MAIDPVRTMALGLLGMIPNLVFLAILVLVTRYALRIIRVLFDRFLDVVNEYSVQIMTPAYERDPDQPKVVPKDQWYAPAPARSPDGSQPALSARLSR